MFDCHLLEMHVLSYRENRGGVNYGGEASEMSRGKGNCGYSVWEKKILLQLIKKERKGCYSFQRHSSIYLKLFLKKKVYFSSVKKLTID